MGACGAGAIGRIGGWDDAVTAIAIRAAAIRDGRLRYRTAQDS